MLRPVVWSFGPLVALVLAGAFLLTPSVERVVVRWLDAELASRARLVNASLRGAAAEALASPDGVRRFRRLADSLVEDERLLGVGLCDRSGQWIYRSARVDAAANCRQVTKDAEGARHVERFEVDATADLVVVHDRGFVAGLVVEARRNVLLLVSILAVLGTLFTWLATRVSIGNAMTLLRTGLRKAVRGTSGARLDAPELGPIVKDLRVLVRDLEREMDIRDESRMSWSPQALKEILKRELAGDEVLVVSNREPYQHVRGEDGAIEARFPASGLVTALEPIVRACSGTWIAHGSGDADRETVDAHDRVAVPPGAPAYRLRRVWLSDQEEDGYYFGFSNEGLWPLCHFAHVRPTFRAEDWKAYVAVNKKFAEVVVAESRTEDPVILVQDYHFALLPKFVREKLPKATILTFWHIPWPNPEAFGICPWKEAILEGLLGSSVVGFHTRYHVNNFLETADRYLESRLDREEGTISLRGRLSMVRHYPISIEWPTRVLAALPSVEQCKQRVLARWSLPPEARIAVGVDRLDYTKGIVERFLAVEKLLDAEPRFRGTFVFVQIAAPSRSRIERYQLFREEVRGLAERINAKHGRNDYQPILLLEQHHGVEAVFEYFRAADVCVVTSLHDGMNLVAKEFIASREDERGALILSCFTGAARELPEALLVNPYDVEECASALREALDMRDVEQRERMRAMRAIVREYNVYRWAGRMLLDAARIRNRSRLLRRFGSPLERSLRPELCS
jgi:trehalose 6-phosphate synthase